MQKKNGFTLVELSIVLVIIGLIVGGIVGGQSLIYSAKMRSFISDIERLKISNNAFKLQYDGLPGDFAEMKLYFPVECAAGSRCARGDGNWKYSYEEAQTTFAHLSLAKLIEGSYVAVNAFTAGVNMPPSPMGEFYYVVRSNGWWALEGKNYIGLENGAAGYPFTAKDAKFLDKKMDNGGAITGNMVWFWGSRNCHNNSDPFVVSSAGNVCRFQMLF